MLKRTACAHWMRGCAHAVPRPYDRGVAVETDYGYRAYDIPVDPDVPLDEVAGRWFGHLVAFALRREMAAGATSAGAVAELLQVTGGHLRKKLAGSTPFTLEDLVRLAVAFGPQLIPQLEGAESIFPPAYRGRLEWDRRAGMARARISPKQAM